MSAIAESKNVYWFQVSFEIRRYISSVVYGTFVIVGLLSSAVFLFPSATKVIFDDVALYGDFSGFRSGVFVIFAFALLVGTFLYVPRIVSLLYELALERSSTLRHLAAWRTKKGNLSIWNIAVFTVFVSVILFFVIASQYGKPWSPPPPHATKIAAPSSRVLLRMVAYRDISCKPSHAASPKPCGGDVMSQQTIRGKAVIKNLGHGKYLVTMLENHG